MNELPSCWTIIPGFLAGCLFIGRVARWLQFVRSIMGKPDVQFAAEPNPRPWKTALSIVAYPTPWIALALAVWAIHHIVTAPFTSEWRWFYGAFFGGPAILTVLIYSKARRVQRQRKSQFESSTRAVVADLTVGSSDRGAASSASQGEGR